MKRRNWRSAPYRRHHAIQAFAALCGMAYLKKKPRG